MNDIEEAISYIENTKKHLLHLGETWYADYLDDALELLKEQEVKTGHWIYKKYDDMFMCSCCEKYSIRNDYPYCHWCGVKMEGR